MVYFDMWSIFALENDAVQNVIIFCHNSEEIQLASD